MTWSAFHVESEHLAAQAELAAKSGDGERARALYRRAAEAEVRALSELDTSKTRTLGITAVSAVALWYKAQDFHAAEHIAYTWLATALLPPFAADQLRQLLQTMWNEAILERAGVKFTGKEILFSVKGDKIVTGGAPLELIWRKIDEVRAFIFRTAEMLIEVPLRKRGPASTAVQKIFNPWLFQAAPGSYQFAVSLQEPPQGELFPNLLPSASLKVEKVASTFVDILKASVEDPEGALTDVVPDSDYRETFLKMTRNLAPTGVDFGKLEVRPGTAPGIRPVVLLPVAREAMNQTLKKQTAFKRKEGQKEAQLIGILRALHLDKDWIEVVIDGKTEHIRGAGDQLDDVLGPMVNRQVIVETFVTRAGRHRLRDIRPAE